MESLVTANDECDGPNTTKPDPNSTTKHGSTKPIEHQETSDQNMNDMCANNIPPEPRLEADDDSVFVETAVVIEQQILVKPYGQDSGTDKEKMSNENNSNDCSNKSLHDEQEPPTKESSKMLVDEEQIESSEETGKIPSENLIHTSTLEKPHEDIPSNDVPPAIESSTMMVDDKQIESNVEASDKIASETIEHTSVEENSNQDITSTDAPLDVIQNPILTTVKSENDTDPNNSSSLALLAQYDTESDDDVREVPLPQTYQNRCVEIDSDSETSDVEFLNEVRGSINLDRLDVDIEAEDDDDEEDGNTRSKKQPKVKGELHLEDLPPIEDLHITVPEEECTELGSIQSIVEQLVLVNALPGNVPLDLETVLFRDKGKLVLGEVFDVLGQVSDPIYCVRFNSNKEIKEKGIEVGQTVYVAPRTEHTQFVILANLMKVRGSDASWENDVEPPPRFIDYSDDEEERSARRPNRKRQSSEGVTYTGRGSYTPRRPSRGNYSSRGGIRPPYQSQGNYNIVGNSWHSNYYQPPTYNQPQYRMPGHPPGGYMRPVINNSPYQQQTPMNTGLVLNPYAAYPPPQAMQQPLFPPRFHQPPPQ